MKRETWNEKEGLRWRWQPNDKDKNLEIKFGYQEMKRKTKRWRENAYTKMKIWDEHRGIRWNRKLKRKMNTKRQRGTLKN